MGKGGKTHMPKAFKQLFNQPEPVMGGKKSAAKKAYMTGNQAPKGFKPSGKIKK